ncbi:MAG TPA: hypothetical protein VFG76_13550 [Candidatus Polarisedimenticolia bacterium]|nr:hypothetical protein [Candidatus Polarisedimenticolia bacterium]
MLPGRRLMGAGALGIADQALLAVANLAVGVALAREMAPAAFGVYVVAFAISLMGLSAQVSLVTDPMIVIGSPRGGADLARYMAAAARIQIRLSLGLAGLIGILALGLRLAWGSTSELPAALAGVALALPACQAQGFVRALFFTRLEPGAVLANDLVFSALRVAGVGVLIMTQRLTSMTAFLVAGVAALAAVLVALPACRDLIAAAPEAARDVWRAHWRYGRWLLATAGAYWCSGQGPAVLASGLLTPVAAAVIKACQYLVAPVNVALNGLDGVLAPRAARIRAAGGEAPLARYLRLVALGFGAAVVIYGLALLPAAPILMETIYKGRYAGYTVIVAILLVDLLFTAISRAPILRLKVAGQTRRIFFGHLWAAILGLSSLLVLAPLYGVQGAAAAAPISSAVLLLYLTLTAKAPTTAAVAAGPAPLVAKGS